MGAVNVDAPDPETRRQVSADLLEGRHRIAATANEAFLDRHPEWRERFGHKARTRGEEDARFHVKYLAAAVQVGSPQLFRDYLRWTASVLASRGIAPGSLHEHVRAVLAACDAQLDQGAAAWVRRGAEPALVEAVDADVETWEEPPVAPQPDLELFTEAALRGDRAAAIRVVEEALAAGATVRDIYVDLLQASQYEVGRRWQTNRISVAREHMATAVTQAVLTMLYGRLDLPARRRGTVVVTGVEGERHQIGAQMVADFLEADGWDVRFLGTQMPHAGILDTIEEEGARLVDISASTAARLPAVRDLVADIQGRFGDHRPGVMVGGSAFRGHHVPWQELGADRLGRDLDEAVAAARALATP